MEFGLTENSTPKLSVLGFPGKSGNMFLKNIVFCNNFLSSAQVCVKERKQLLGGWNPFHIFLPFGRSIGISCLVLGTCTMVHHGAAGQVSGGEACGGDVVKLRITSRHPGGHSVHDNKQVLLPANAANLKNSKSQNPGILSFSFSLEIWWKNV